jgi:hypothetical protein
LRQRTQLIRKLLQRFEKVMEDANIKLAGVAIEVLDKLSRAMIQALIGWEKDGAHMAKVA